MDYTALGQQYLDESAAIDKRIKALRHDVKHNGCDCHSLLLLTEMRLDLRTVGKDLIERGKHTCKF